MSVDKLSVDRMSGHIITVDEMPAMILMKKMSIDEMTIDKMTFYKMPDNK
jgi:hypothetical protein